MLDGGNGNSLADVNIPERIRFAVYNGIGVFRALPPRNGKVIRFRYEIAESV